MTIPEVVGHMESAGVKLWLEGSKVRLKYSNEEQRHSFGVQISFLRMHRSDVAEFLSLRNSDMPVMPSGVRLITWDPKQPPVVLETFLVVTDSVRFAESALREIHEHLTNPKRKYGWSVKQLINHLEMVGVVVEIDSQIQKDAF